MRCELNILKLKAILKLGRSCVDRALALTKAHPRPSSHPTQALRRSVLACMLWENEFYEDGVSIAGRIRELVPRVTAEKVAALAVEARTAMKLRHAPLLLVREMARHTTHRSLVAETLARVIQRADELTEFVAIYWADGRRPLSAQVKKGLAAAFTRFDEYALAKYDRAGIVRLRDVLFLSHAKPMTSDQALVWRRLIAGELATPDTWEVALSSGGDKRAHWERLLIDHRLGSLALLRNLRNMKDAGAAEDLVIAAIDAMRTDRVLPFRFLAAARHAPQWEEALERAIGVPAVRSKRARSQRWSGSARGTHGRPRRRLRLHGRAVVAPFADASHRTLPTDSPCFCARSPRRLASTLFSNVSKADPAPAWIRSARCDGVEPAAPGDLPRCSTRCG